MILKFETLLRKSPTGWYGFDRTVWGFNLVSTAVNPGWPVSCESVEDHELWKMKFSPLELPSMVPLVVPLAWPLPLAAASGSHEGHMVTARIDRGGWLAGGVEVVESRQDDEINSIEDPQIGEEMRFLYLYAARKNKI